MLTFAGMCWLWMLLSDEDAKVSDLWLGTT